MASTILASECINCAACESECPNTAISSGGDAYVIDPTLCDECAAAGGDRACAAVCPTDAIITAA